MAWTKLEHTRRYKIMKVTVGKRKEEEVLVATSVADFDDDPVPGEGEPIAPFDLLDYSVVTYRKQATNSLNAFLDLPLHTHSDA